MREQNSKKKYCKWTTRLLVCFIVLSFVLNLGFAGLLSARESNGNDNNESESDEDFCCPFQLDPLVKNRALNNIMDILASDYGVDPSEELRDAVRGYISGAYKEQLVEDIKVANEALGLPKITVGDINVALNLLAADIDYLDFEVRKRLLNVNTDNLKELLDSFEDSKATTGLSVGDFFEGRSLQAVLDSLPGNLNIDQFRPGMDLLEEHSKEIPSATGGLGDPGVPDGDGDVGTTDGDGGPIIFDQDLGHYLSGGNGNSSSNGVLGYLAGWARSAASVANTLGKCAAAGAGFSALAGPPGKPLAVALAGGAAGAFVSEQAWLIAARILETINESLNEGEEPEAEDENGDENGENGDENGENGDENGENGDENGEDTEGPVKDKEDEKDDRPRGDDTYYEERHDVFYNGDYSFRDAARVVSEGLLPPGFWDQWDETEYGEGDFEDPDEGRIDPLPPELNGHDDRDGIEHGEDGFIDPQEGIIDPLPRDHPDADPLGDKPGPGRTPVHTGPGDKDYDKDRWHFIY